MKHRFLIIISFLLVLALPQGRACTVAVISGKYTTNGRPMLWKNRDTWALNNQVVQFKGEKYNFVGLINSSDVNLKSIWIGMNDAGFAIMNSASYNLNHTSEHKLTGLEGQLMKEALEKCGSLKQFEKLLDSKKKPTGLEANFGVIDAYGGAAFYEFGHEGYTKVDVNDPLVAPFGYVIRGNYSNTGEIGVGSGYIRYNTVHQMFFQEATTIGLSPEFIETKVAKGLNHSLLKEDLKLTHGDLPENTPKYAHFRDYIPRSGSSSSVTIEGVKEGESPELITFYGDIGFPLCSVVVPVWIKSGIELPRIVSLSVDYKDSPICHAAMQLKTEKVMNIKWGKTDKYYIDVNALYNIDKTGIRQLLEPIEKKVYLKTNELMKEARAKGDLSSDKVKEFYNYLDSYYAIAYNELFKIEL